MIVTGKVVYAHTGGTANYHQQGSIAPDIVFDHLVNGLPTGTKCSFIGRVVWEGVHAGQVAILPNSSVYATACASECRDVYYANVDWEAGTFKCHMPDALAYCCTQNEGDTASMQLRGTVWTPRCVVENRLGCPDSAYFETKASVKTPGGWLTLIQRVPSQEVLELILVNEDCNIIDTVILPVPYATKVVVHDDTAYVTKSVNTGQLNCWMSLEYPYAVPPSSPYVELCYDIYKHSIYELKLTVSGFEKTVHEYTTGPLGECSFCEWWNDTYGGGFTVRMTGGPTITQKGRVMRTLYCLDPARVPGSKGGAVAVESALGEMGCGECQSYESAWNHPVVHADGVQFIQAAGFWHRYNGCLWAEYLPAPHYRMDYWYNHTEMKYSSSLYGTPLAMVDGALITTTGQKLSMTDGSLIKQITDPQLSCCLYQNADGNFVGRDWRQGFPPKAALFNSDLDFIAECCGDSGDTLSPVPMNLNGGTNNPPPRNGGVLAMPFSGTWRFCSAVPWVDNSDKCPEYMRITACQIEEVSSTCGQENVFKVKARFTVKTTPGGTPVSDAAVSCVITGKVNTTQTGQTDINGVAAFETDCFAGTGTVAFRVDAVEKEGLGYLPSRNVCSDATWIGPLDCSDPPTPNPAAFTSDSPYQFYRSADGTYYHIMQAIQASHAGVDGVEYRFACATVPSLDSGWRNADTVAGQTFPNGQTQAPHVYWAAVGSVGRPTYRWTVQYRARGCATGGTPSASKQVM
jgi:hypothetical protein